MIPGVPAHRLDGIPVRRAAGFAWEIRIFAPQLYGVSRFRPFRRRAANTRRPPGVRMRTRNPCVFARLRLFG